MSELSTATAALTLAATEMKEAKESFENVREVTDKRVAAKEAEVDAFLTGADNRILEKEEETDAFLLEANERIGNTPFDIDLRGLDSNLFYPIFMQMSSLKPIDLKIFRRYAYDRDEDLSYAGLYLHVIANGGTWGGNPVKMKVISNEQTYIKTAGAIGFGGYCHPMIFLRGGYLYHGLSSKSEQSVQILTEKTTYYIHKTDSKYDLTAGPVDEVTVSESNSALPMSSSFIDLGRANIAQLGS